jgi:hypothetical protein
MLLWVFPGEAASVRTIITIKASGRLICWKLAVLLLPELLNKRNLFVALNTVRVVWDAAGGNCYGIVEYNDTTNA